MDNNDTTCESIENPGLEIFGTFLIEQVRDATIFDLNKMIEGTAKGNNALAVKELINTLNSQNSEAAQKLFPIVVDMLLDKLLWALEQEQSIDVLVHPNNIAVIDIREVSDGLSGELYGRRGWIARFSRYASSED